jgi:(p)ppGpp synthase/HD superfamily hydrolase
VTGRIELSDRFEEALAFASKLHRQQRRKGSGIPYISHLLAVASLVLEMGGDEDQAIAGLLHDSIEDQGLTEANIAVRYNSRVASIVAACTDGELGDRLDKSFEGWQSRKRLYVAGLPNKSDDALLVSLADKTHNASSIVADLVADGPTVFDRFTGKRDGTLWYYNALLGAFRTRMPGPPTERLGRIVAETESH